MGLYSVLKKHVVTVLVMNVFSICQMNQGVALCVCEHWQDLGRMLFPGKAADVQDP